MTEVLFVEYPKCSTCQKAKKWLENNNIKFKSRHIVENAPTYEELKQWHKLSGKELKSFFNTSGLVYKSMNLKDKLPLMNEDEQLHLLSGNGMLIKRPLLIGKNFALAGFNENAWTQQTASFR